MRTSKIDDNSALDRRILSLDEVKALMIVLEKPENRACAAAVALMLWGNVGYNDLAQIKWQDMWDVSGAVVAPMPEKLLCWLKELGYLGIPEASVLPRGWSRLWSRLKHELSIRNAYVLHATCRYYSFKSAEQGATELEKERFWTQMWD